MKKILKTTAFTALAIAVWRSVKGRHHTDKNHQSGARAWRFSPIVGSALLAGVTSMVMTAPAYAMNESLVQSFANSMSQAANAQNIGMVSRLIDDNAAISLTRKGNTATLDKNAYLQLLQKSWAGASDYRYDISVTDVVVTGNQARATVVTTESWTKDGRRTVFKTHSKATLSYVGGNAMLLRAVSQATIE